MACNCTRNRGKEVISNPVEAIRTCPDHPSYVGDHAQLHWHFVIDHKQSDSVVVGYAIRMDYETSLTLKELFKLAYETHGIERKDTELAILAYNSAQRHYG